jgi:hypothetical protein
MVVDAFQVSLLVTVPAAVAALAAKARLHALRYAKALRESLYTTNKMSIYVIRENKSINDHEIQLPSRSACTSPPFREGCPEIRRRGTLGTRSRARRTPYLRRSCSWTNQVHLANAKGGEQFNK